MHSVFSGGKVHSSRFSRATKPEGHDPRQFYAWHLVLLLSLALLQIWAAIGSNGTWDTFRDFYFAQRISVGAEFPLSGPSINNMLHLGPAWFYLLALPLWLFPHPLTVAVTMAVLGALQFPLAYQLGRQFESSRLGLLFALALVLPGWSAFPLVSLTHVSVVVTCILVGVLAALAYRRRPTMLRAALLGLSIGAMLHAHPTTLLIGTLLAASCAGVVPRSRRVAHFLIVAAASILLFVPAAYDQWRLDLPDLHTTATYANSSLGVPSLARIGGLFLGVFDFGADYVTRYWIDLPNAIRSVLRAINALILIAAAAGLAAGLSRRSPRRAWTGVLVGTLVAQTIFVLAIRPVMPFWMVFAHLPVIAALVALGLDRWCNGAARYWVGAAVMVWTSWSAATLASIALAPTEIAEPRLAPGEMGLMNVGQHSNSLLRFRVARLPMADLYAIAQPLCQPVTLYAHYAAFIDASFGVGAVDHCGNPGSIQLGGPPQPQRTLLVGLRDYAWAAIGLQPHLRLGALGVATPAEVWHSPRYLAMNRADIYPSRWLALAPKRFRVSGDAPTDARIVIGNRIGRYEVMQNVSAYVDGVEIDPIYSDLITRVYTNPWSQRATAHWDIDIEATSDYIDVLTLKPEP